MSDSTLEFRFEAGIGSRSTYRQQVEVYCFKQDLKCEVYEQKSLLSSVFYFKVSGDVVKLRQMKLDLENWFTQLAGLR